MENRITSKGGYFSLAYLLEQLNLLTSGVNSNFL